MLKATTEQVLESWLDNVYAPCFERLVKAGMTERQATRELSIAMSFKDDLIEFVEEVENFFPGSQGDCE